MARDFGGSKSNRSTSTSEANVLGRGIRVRGMVNGASDLDRKSTRLNSSH